MKRPELEALRLFQLKRLASRLGIVGRSNMSKAELVKALVGKEPPPSKRRLRSRRKPPAPAPVRAVERPAAKPAAKAALKPAPKAAPARPAAPPPAPQAARPAAPPAPAFQDTGEVPRYYGVDRVVLLPRDPNWLYAYWELTPQRVEWGLHNLGVSAPEAKALLRVHDLTDLVETERGRPNLAASRNYTAIEVAPMAEDWYIRVPHADRVYCVEYLLQAPDGRTVVLMTSNRATTPSDRVSGITDEEWVTGFPDRRLVARERGPARTKWLIGRRPGAPTSPGFGSGAVR